MKTTVQVEGLYSEELKQTYFINMIDLSERQIDGFISTGAKTLIDELRKLCKENEIVAYRAKSTSNFEWNRCKLEWRKQWRKQNENNPL